MLEQKIKHILYQCPFIFHHRTLIEVIEICINKAPQIARGQYMIGWFKTPEEQRIFRHASMLIYPGVLDSLKKALESFESTEDIDYPPTVELTLEILKICLKHCLEFI